MIRSDASRADWLFSVGTVSLLVGFFVLLGGWASDARVAIVGGRAVAIGGAALLIGGIFLQAVQWISERRGGLGSAPRHSAFSKTAEVKFGLKFFLMALMRRRDFPTSSSDDYQAPLPPLLG